MSESVTRLINQSSVEVSKNSRGWTYSVKAYGSDSVEIRVKLNELMKVAEEIIKSREASEASASSSNFKRSEEVGVK